VERVARGGDGESEQRGEHRVLLNDGFEEENGARLGALTVAGFDERRSIPR